MKNLAVLGVDKQTKDRLAKLAGDIPMARYLRELSLSLSGENQVEGKLDELKMRIILKTKIDAVYHQMGESDVVFNDDGGVNYKKSGHKRIPEIQGQLILQTLEENPDTTCAGWWRWTGSRWIFNQKSYEREFGSQEAK